MTVRRSRTTCSRGASEKKLGGSTRREKRGGREALARLAGDDSRVQFTDNISQLFDFLAELHAKVCN